MELLCLLGVLGSRAAPPPVGQVGVETFFKPQWWHCKEAPGALGSGRVLKLTLPLERLQGQLGSWLHDSVPCGNDPLCNPPPHPPPPPPQLPIQVVASLTHTARTTSQQPTHTTPLGCK